ncbi:MAG: UDP-glucose 4-epimerase family protein [Gammaproteobacteria bacterium]
MQSTDCKANGRLMARCVIGGMSVNGTKTVLVTGANGFIGGALCRGLADADYQIVGAVRQSRESTTRSDAVRYVACGDINAATDWDPLLTGVDVIVHLAARVHVMRETEVAPLHAFRRTNVDGSEALARQAAEHGVRRMVFVSTVKVNGERTGSRAFSEDSTASPADPYAVSKWEAEQRLADVAAGSQMELVIVRPPLVYGPGVGGNFLRLLRMVDKGIPLPFGRLTNKRSLVSVYNLCDLLRSCVTSSSAGGEVFLVSDGEDLTTPDLIYRIAGAMGKSARVWPFPVTGVRAAFSVLGKSAEFQRLADSLQVSIRKSRELLGWQPPYSVEQSIGETVGWYAHNGR